MLNQFFLLGYIASDMYRGETVEKGIPYIEFVLKCARNPFDRVAVSETPMDIEMRAYRQDAIKFLESRKRGDLILVWGTLSPDVILVRGSVSRSVTPRIFNAILILSAEDHALIRFCYANKDNVLVKRLRKDAEISAGLRKATRPRTKKPSAG